MTRMIAGVLLVMTLGAGTMFADDYFHRITPNEGVLGTPGWRDRRDIRCDESRIAHDRRELRRDLYYGNYAAARHERRELRRDYRDLRQDLHDLYWDRR